MKTIIAALALASASAASQAASFTTLTLPTLNVDIRGWTDGGTYAPLFPGTSTYGGIPFALAVDAHSNTAFLADGTSLDITVGVYGVTTAYSLINSAWGEYGTNVGSMEFFGSAGGHYKVDLVEGTNVRDHFDDGYNNVIDGWTAVPWFNVGPGRARLDAQIYKLPGVFATQTLTKITFTGFAKGAEGVPFIAGATVAAVPEPDTLALMGVGIGVLMVLRRRT